MALNRFEHFGTDAIHAGQHADATTGAVMTPISMSTTFAQSSPGVHGAYEYSRTNNPTRDAFERNVAGCEKGKYGIAFSSGCAALASILNMFQSGAEIICHMDMYGGTNRFFTRIATPSNNFTFKKINMTNIDEVKASLTDKTKFVWMETPTNPTLTILDIKSVCDVVHEYNKDIIVAVDNTFLSPFNQRPLTLGADFVVHSVSKYINGHSDVIMGVVVTNSDSLNQRLRFIQNGIGAVPSPFDCYLALRGMKTLHVRMERHERNALAIAKFLQSHPKVDKVKYTGLSTHPQYELICKQQSGHGGMVTIWLKGGIDESRKFLETVSLFQLAESLGGVESLIEHPGIMTHASIPAEERKKLGISDSLIRISVGIEDEADLIADLLSALDAI